MRLVELDWNILDELSLRRNARRLRRPCDPVTQSPAPLAYCSGLSRHGCIPKYSWHSARGEADACAPTPGPNTGSWFYVLRFFSFTISPLSTTDAAGQILASSLRRRLGPGTLDLFGVRANVYRERGVRTAQTKFSSGSRHRRSARDHHVLSPDGRSSSRCWSMAKL